jgi:hypothetical protein
MVEENSEPSNRQRKGSYRNRHRPRTEALISTEATAVQAVRHFS